MAFATGSSTPRGLQDEKNGATGAKRSLPSSDESLSSTVLPASTPSSGRSSVGSSTSPEPVSAPRVAVWSAGTFAFPPCSPRSIQSLPVPTQNSRPPTVPKGSSIPPPHSFDEFTELFTVPDRAGPRSKASSARLRNQMKSASHQSWQTNRTHHTRESNSDSFVFGRTHAPAPLEESGSFNTIIFRRDRPFAMGRSLAFPDGPSGLTRA